MVNLKTVLGLFGLLALPALAGSQTASQVTVPDQRGYVLKMTQEMIGLAVTRNPDERVGLFVRSGDERLKELERMGQEGKTSHHAALGNAYYSLVTQGACGLIESGGAKGKDMTASIGRYAAATTKHIQVLEGVLAKVPPQARGGILRALEASRHGHEQALEAHQRGKRNAGGPGGNPHRQGGPGAVTPPGGAGAPDDSRGPGKGHAGPPPLDDARGKSGAPGGGPGKGNNPPGPPPGKGRGADDGPPGKGKDQHGPPPGKGKSEDEGEAGKGNGPKGPPPGKGKEK